MQTVVHCLIASSSSLLKSNRDQKEAGCCGRGLLYERTRLGAAIRESRPERNNVLGAYAKEGKRKKASPLGSGPMPTHENIAQDQMPPRVQTAWSLVSRERFSATPCACKTLETNTVSNPRGRVSREKSRPMTRTLFAIPESLTARRARGRILGCSTRVARRRG